MVLHTRWSRRPRHLSSNLDSVLPHTSCLSRSNSHTSSCEPRALFKKGGNIIWITYGKHLGRESAAMAKMFQPGRLVNIFYSRFALIYPGTFPASNLYWLLPTVHPPHAFINILIYLELPLHMITLTAVGVIIIITYYRNIIPRFLISSLPL